MPQAAMRSAFGAKHTQDSNSERHPKIQIIELARTASGIRSGLYRRAGVGVTDPGSSHHSDFTNDFAGKYLWNHGGVGRGCGVGRGRGVALGVAVGVTLGVAVGVTLGVTVGVTLGVTVGVTLGVAVGVGVGVPPGQIPWTLIT
jgi:hypothetical protein